MRRFPWSLGAILVFFILAGCDEPRQSTVKGDRNAAGRQGQEANTAPRQSTPPELVFQVGHQRLPTRGAITPDGTRLLTSGDDGAAILWDIASARQIASYGGDGWVSPLAISPDGDHFVIGAGLWSLKIGVKELEFNFNGAPYCACFSPDGRIVAYGLGEEKREAPAGWINLYDVLSGRFIKDIRTFREPVQAVRFTPDGKQLLALSAEDAFVGVVDVSTGQLDGTLMVNLKGVSQAGPRVLEFSRDGRRFVAAAGRTVEIWDFRTRERLKSLDVGPGAITTAVFTPDGASTIVATADMGDADAGYAGTLAEWDIDSGERTAQLSEGLGFGSPYGFLAFSPDNRLLLASSVFRGGGDTPNLTKRLAGATTAEKASHIKRWQWPERTPLDSLPLRPRDFRYDFDRFSEDGKRFYGSASNEPCLSWDLESAQLITYSTSVRGYGIKIDGSDAVVFDRSTDRDLHRLHSERGKLRTATLSEDGRWAATAAEDGSVVVWDIASERAGPVLNAHELTIHTVAFAASGKRLFTADDELAVLWDPATGRELNRFIIVPKESLSVWRPYGYPRGYPQGQMAVAPDGKRFATISSVKSGEKSAYVAALWNVESGEKTTVPLEVRLSGSQEPELAFSPDGRLLGIRSADEVYLCRAESGDVFAVLSAKPADIRMWTFSPDGKRMMTGLSDYTMALWRTDGEFLARFAVDTNADWVIATSRGYFHGTPEGIRMIGWKIANAVFPADLYEERFHRPDLVARTLMGLPLPEAEARAELRRPPQVKIDLEGMTARSARVRATATPGETTRPIRSARLLVDGRDAAIVGARPFRRLEESSGATVFEGEVDFPTGKTVAVVAAVVTDTSGVRSVPATMTIVRSGSGAPVDRRLIVLSVGISRYRDPDANLCCADADATDLARLLDEQRGRAYSQVVSRTVTNETATRQNIRDALAWLGEQATPADTAVVLFSGHGGIDRVGRLYYVPYDADGNPARTWLPWDEVADALRKVTASAVVFFSDCCHAGAFGQRAPAHEALAEPLVRGSGVMVFAASRGMESSLELKSLRHGAFTYALLEGLRGKADLIADGRITISELQTYVANEVKQLTEDRQHPHIPLMNDFDPETVIVFVR